MPTSPLPTSPSGSPEILFPLEASPSQLRGSHIHLKDSADDVTDRVMSTHDKMYEGVDVEDLVEQLKDVETLSEQADIIHYLFMVK